MIPLIAWLLTQFVSPSVFALHQDTNFSSASPDVAANFASDAVVICTPGGFVLIKVDSNGERLPEDQTFYPGCQWCQAFGAPANVSGPVHPGLPLRAPSDSRYEAITAEVPTGMRGTHIFQSRAPPLSSIA